MHGAAALFSDAEPQPKSEVMAPVYPREESPCILRGKMLRCRNESCGAFRDTVFRKPANQTQQQQLHNA
jgi:hypothetical protein